MTPKELFGDCFQQFTCRYPTSWGMRLASALPRGAAALVETVAAVYDVAND